MVWLHPTILFLIALEVANGMLSLLLAAAICLPPASDPLSVDLETFQQHLAINTTSTYAASQEAVRSFDAIADKTVPCTFIYTGNKLSTVVMAPLITLGVGKAASAHFIEMAAGSYAEKGYG